MGSSAPLAFFTGGIGWQEIMLIMAVLLIFFGRRIPEVMRSLGKGVSQFKKGLSEVENEVRNVTEATAVRPGDDDFPEKSKEEAKGKPEKGSGEGAREEPRKELAAPRPDAEDVAQDAGEGKAKSKVESKKDPGELAG